MVGGCVVPGAGVEVLFESVQLGKSLGGGQRFDEIANLVRMLECPEQITPGRSGIVPVEVDLSEQPQGTDLGSGGAEIGAAGEHLITAALGGCQVAAGEGDLAPQSRDVDRLILQPRVLKETHAG